MTSDLQLICLHTHPSSVRGPVQCFACIYFGSSDVGIFLFQYLCLPVEAMEQITQSGPVVRLLLLLLARRGAATAGRRRLCCGAASAGRRRDLPRYRFELENRLLFGNVVRTTPRAAAAVAPPQPPSQLTIVSEAGFPEGGVGRPVRSRPTPGAPSVSAEAASSAPSASTVSVSEPDDSPVVTPAAAAVSASMGARAAAAPLAVSYLYPAAGEEGAVSDPAGRLPSVSRVLQATMSEESRAALQRWEEKMIARHGPDGFAQIKEGRYCEVQGRIQQGGGGARSPSPMTMGASAPSMRVGTDL